MPTRVQIVSERELSPWLFSSARLFVHSLLRTRFCVGIPLALIARSSILIGISIRWRERGAERRPYALMGFMVVCLLAGITIAIAVAWVLSL
jgi:hypothetical protein